MTKDFVLFLLFLALQKVCSVTHTWTRATVRMCSFNLVSIKASVSQRETGVCMCVFMWPCDKREAMFRAGPAPLLTRNHAIILSLPILHWCLETHSAHTHIHTQAGITQTCNYTCWWNPFTVMMHKYLEWPQLHLVVLICNWFIVFIYLRIGKRPSHNPTQAHFAHSVWPDVESRRLAQVFPGLELLC